MPTAPKEMFGYKKGKFMPERATKAAVFASIGKGTCNFSNLKLTVEPGEINREQGKTGKKGKRISFGPEGRYETKDTKEIIFLKWKEENPNRFSRIKCIQEPEFN